MVTLNGSMRWVFLPEGGYVHDPGTGEIWALNRTAAFLLKLVHDGTSWEEAVARLALETGVDVETCRADADELLDRLEGLGCVCR